VLGPKVPSAGDIRSALTVRVGLEGALDGWVATWRWQIADGDGDPLPLQADIDPDTEGPFDLVLMEDVTLSPPGRVALGVADTSRALRELKVPFMRQAVLIGARAAAVTSPAWARLARQLEERRPGRKGRPDEYYVDLVLRRLRAEEKAPGRPVAWLAEREGVSARHLRDQLSEARRRELIKYRPTRLTSKGKRLASSMRQGTDVSKRSRA
jgi:hypothetical protein